MPCNSEYMEQNGKEARLQQTAKLLVFALTALGQKVPKAVKDAANTYYCNADFVPKLCKVLGEMTPEQQLAIIYDGRSKTSRELADWWDEHQEADKKRVAAEQKIAADKALFEQAKVKMSKEEFEALKKFFR